MALLRIEPHIVDTIGNFVFQSATVTANITTGNASLGNLASANYFSGNGSLLTSINGSNITGQAANALVAGTVYTNAQPNITSVGTLTSLEVTGNVTASYIIGNGSQLTGLPAGYTDSDANSAIDARVTKTFVENLGITGGAIISATAPSSPSDGDLWVDSDTGDMSVYFGSAWAAVSAQASTAQTVTDNAQPNITSVGTLVDLTVSGNVTANYFIGDGSLLTGLPAGYTDANANSAIDARVTKTFVDNLSVVANIANVAYSVAVGNITGIGNIATLNLDGNASTILYGNGTFAAAPVTYNDSNVESYLPTYAGNLSPNNLVVSTSANLGAVGNVIITGGSANYVLTTDGAGSLSWAEQSGGSSTSTTIGVDNFTGDGSTDTFTLSVAPTSINSVFVNYNGTFVGRGSYSLAGANLTFGSIPANGASIEVTTIDGLTIGSGAFTTRTATGDGSETDYTVTSGATVSSVLVTIDGVLQTPTTDYTISGSTLTFTTAPYSGGAIQIRELSVASSSSGSGASNISIRAQAMTMGIIFGG